MDQPIALTPRYMAGLTRLRKHNEERKQYIM